jgi:hypothetical protein
MDEIRLERLPFAQAVTSIKIVIAVAAFLDIFENSFTLFSDFAGIGGIALHRMMRKETR